jgi:hypothetical protein
VLTIAGGILIAVAALVALAVVIAVIAACWEEIVLPALGIAAILGALCVGGPLALWLARNWDVLLLGVGMVAGWIGFLYVLGRAASVVARKLRKYPWFIF